jgi:hypothetical protein
MAVATTTMTVRTTQLYMTCMADEESAVVALMTHLTTTLFTVNIPLGLGPFLQLLLQGLLLNVISQLPHPLSRVLFRHVKQFPVRASRDLFLQLVTDGLKLFHGLVYPIVLDLCSHFGISLK